MPTRAELAKIHIAKKSLELSDEAYRGMLFSQTGEESSRGLSSAQTARILNHFKRLGWSPGKRGTRRSGMASPAQLRKIKWIWMTGKGIRQKNLGALRHFIQSRFGLSALRFIESSQVTAILAAINSMNHRVAP